VGEKLFATMKVERMQTKPETTTVDKLAERLRLIGCNKKKFRRDLRRWLAIVGVHVDQLSPERLALIGLRLAKLLPDPPPPKRPPPKRLRKTVRTEILQQWKRAALARKRLGQIENAVANENVAPR
jgi:hypothetical protein